VIVEVDRNSNPVAVRALTQPAERFGSRGSRRPRSVVWRPPYVFAVVPGPLSRTWRGTVLYNARMAEWVYLSEEEEAQLDAQLRADAKQFFRGLAP
jgi:hypothetical protein